MPAHSTVNKLTNKQSFELGLWLRQVDLAPFTTWSALAEAAQAAVGFPVTSNNARSSLEMVGLKLPSSERQKVEPEVSAEDFRELARIVDKLCSGTINLNNDLAAIRRLAGGSLI